MARGCSEESKPQNRGESWKFVGPGPRSAAAGLSRQKAARTTRLKFQHCCKVFATRRNFPASLCLPASREASKTFTICAKLGAQQRKNRVGSKRVSRLAFLWSTPSLRKRTTMSRGVKFGVHGVNRSYFHILHIGSHFIVECCYCYCSTTTTTTIIHSN